MASNRSTWTCDRRRRGSSMAGWSRFFARHGVRIVRLDAVGYVVKKAGTSCFMVEPEIWEVLDWLRSTARSLEGLVVLPEVHDVVPDPRTARGTGYWTYDFVLPGLVLLAFETGDADTAGGSPRAVTRAPVHDPGLSRRDPGPTRPRRRSSSPSRWRVWRDPSLERGGNVNRILSEVHADGLDVHQLNCTYYSALGEDDRRYLAARAIQLFAPGVPQVYYVGLLAGANDQAAVERTGEGRAVNRHDYTRAEIDEALARPVVREVLELLRLRATHAAFDGPLMVETPLPNALRLAWSAGAASCVLDVDVISNQVRVTIDGQVDQTGGVMRAG